MEIEYLYEFTVIARMESFSRAAEELCISQSSLSKHILALERELGSPILQRNSRSVGLTPMGAEILPLAVQIGSLNHQIHAIASARQDREKRTLAIASIPVMAQYNITGMLAGFRRLHPQVTLEITECEQKDLGELLESCRCELAFLRQGLEPVEELETLVLCRDRLVAVMAEDHPFAGREHIRISELCDEPLLFLDQQTGFHHLYSALCREAGFVPRIAYTGSRPENIIELAGQRMGVALVMAGHAAYVSGPEVRAVPLEPPVERAICLARWRGRPHTRLAEDFWNYVAEMASGAADVRSERSDTGKDGRDDA